MKTLQTERITDKSGRHSLVAGALATLLASTCCLGPLLLISLGFSGAWISTLTVLGPFQPIFIGVALVALFFAGKRIWRPVTQCASGEVCALPIIQRGYQILFIGVCALLLAVFLLPLIASRFY